MLSTILKSLGGLIKTTRDQVDKSTEGIEDILEKEYVYKATQKLKEASGKLVETTGMAAQKLQEGYEALRDDIKSGELEETVQKSAENIKEVISQGIEKGKDLAEDVLDRDNIKESIDKVKAYAEEAKEKATDAYNDLNEHLDKKDNSEQK